MGIFRGLNFKIINIKSILNRYCSTKTNKNTIKYTDTINLPKTKFPPRLSAVKRNEIERQLNSNCLSSLYQWQRENLNSKEFILHDGPPYANGDLHMGHAVNKILKDIILKYNIANRTKVHYKPGWDCHGLPIELKALSTASQSKLSPLEIRQKARKFALDTIEKQKSEFYSWGITADFKNTENIYKTIDQSYVQNQFRLFLDLYENGLIYRDLKPVYWSPSSRTALAEAELEYNPNFESPSITLRLKIKQSSLPQILKTYNESIYCLIWTTTPWSLPTNQGVCFNPELGYSLIKFANRDGLYIVATSRIADFSDVQEILLDFNGNNLQHCSYSHPINSDENLPFFSAKHVQATKGTGLVHTSPAHGPEDFLVALENKIQVKCFVDENGIYSKEAPEFLRGKNALTEGNLLIMDFLKKDILISETIKHSYPIDWRTKKPVIIRASDQWFINTDNIKDAALNQVQNIQLYPKTTADINRNNLINQIQKRPYWCISRQRVWGTPIPVFYHRSTGKPIINRQIIDHLISLVDEKTTTDFWWTLPLEQLLPKSILDEMNLQLDDIEKGKDILDIWFDSGISWSYALNEPKIADLYLEGVDQFTGWFQSSLLTSIGLRNKSPYKSIFVHGFTVDENGRKMSKSTGNVIDPKTIILKYGIDTLRWWIAAHSTQHSLIPVSHTLIQSSAENIQKFRSILKYLVGCLPAEKNDDDINFEINKCNMLDNYFLNSLANFEQEVFSIYATYQFNRVTACILNFVSNDLSGLYLHIIKDRLYCGTMDEHKELQLVLKGAFLVLCKALWPITPFLVEECWSYYSDKPFYQSEITVPKNWLSTDYNEIINECISQRYMLHQVANDTNTWTLNVTIACEMSTMFKLQALQKSLMEPEHDSQLCELLQVSSATIVPCEDIKNDSQMNVQKIAKSLCNRCRRFAVSSTDTICSRCVHVLTEKHFL